jgi:hypothetical protein
MDLFPTYKVKGFGKVQPFQVAWKKYMGTKKDQDFKE